MPRYASVGYPCCRIVSALIDDSASSTQNGSVSKWIMRIASPATMTRMIAIGSTIRRVLIGTANGSIVGDSMFIKSPTCILPDGIHRVFRRGQESGEKKIYNCWREQSDEAENRTDSRQVH